MTKRAKADRERRHAPPTPIRQNRPAGRRSLSSRRLAIAVVLVAACVVAAFIVFGRHGAEVPARAAWRPNVLLITLDTTRADHLGCYGYARARTRHIDRLAAEGVRFDEAFSPVPLTLPAHASILTGLYPPEHGVRNNGNFYLGDRFATLATILKSQGYRTAAFVSSFILDRRYGLGRGFDTYDDRMEGSDPRIVTLEAERRGDRTALALSRWLEQQAAASSGSPLFAWLHLYDPHEPYHAPPPFGPAFADSPYDGEIAFDDAIVASIVDKLAQLGLAQQMLIAIVGDHGESLGDHGEETHSMFVYDPAVRVPLILWAPGHVPAGRVVTQPVRAIDLAPTIVEYLGAPPMSLPHARSLVPLIDCSGAPCSTASAPPPAYAETLLPQLYMNWAPLRSIRDERWKLIDAPRPELYDLRSDPGETNNVFAAKGDTARALQRELDRVTGGDTGAMTVATMDRETLEKLASLGYVGAGAEPSKTTGGEARPDPKDMIATFNQLRAANAAVRDRRFPDALPILRDVLGKDPHNAFAQLVLGSAHMGMGDYRAAIAQYTSYLQLVPTSSYAHQWMAICYLRLEDRANAMREADAALAIDPHFSDARILKGGVLAARGDYPAAIAELRAAVQSDPTKVVIRLDLAKVLAEAGREADAQAEYEAALKIQPDYAPALSGLGAIYGKQNELEQAAAVLERALEVDPNADDARFNLGKVLARQGRTADARAEYERLLGGSTPAAIRAAAKRELATLK